VPVADALLRVLADRQVSPTVLSSGHFRHAAILRGKFGGVNFPSLRFGAASSEQLFLSRLRVHGGKAPAAVAPKRRSGAPRRRKGWRSPRRCARFGGHWKTRQRLGLSTLRPAMRDYGGRAVALHRFRFKAQHGRTSCRANGKAFRPPSP
jgi:hypothetical protein